MPELSVIIVNWNAREHLRNCLSTIMAEGSFSSLEVVVVDNASRDGSYEMVKKEFPSVTALNSGGNIGFGKANNLGLKQAHGDFVLFLNPDTLVDKGALGGMVSFIERRKEVGALSCRITYGPEQDIQVGLDGDAHTVGLQWFPNPLNVFFSMFILTDKLTRKFKAVLPYQDPSKDGYVSKLYGACLMVRGDLIRNLGGFDDRFFMYCEDVDLSRRITDAGWKLYYLSSITISHYRGVSSNKAEGHFASLMTCESTSKLMKKYYGNTAQILYVIGVFTGSFLRIIIAGTVYLFKTIFHKETTSIGNSLSKYMSLLMWSLRLKKPEIMK